MAHDVVRSEVDVAAQVRKSLVERITQERMDLWIPSDTQWEWREGSLKLIFSTKFACKLASRMLQKDLEIVLASTYGNSSRVTMENCNSKTTVDHTSVRAKPTLRAYVPVDDCPQNRRAPRTAEAASEFAVVPRVRSESTFASNSARADDGDSQPLVGQSLVGTALPADTGIPADIEVQKYPEVPKEAARPRVTEEIVIRSTAVFNPWSQFVAGASNQLAWTAANLILKDPGAITPVLFHGPNGVGKTHLAVAIAHQLRSGRQMRRVLHLSSEQFTNDFTEAILGSGLPMFRRKYRDLEALFLDDIQFLVGKKATISELRHTVDILLKGGRQVVFLADRSLPELEALGPELTARLRGGLVSPLMPLDEQTRYEMLHRDLQKVGLSFPDEFVRQIATRLSGDGRALKGVTKRLMAIGILHGKQLSWDQIWNSVFDLIQATQPVVRLKDIERVVCDFFGLEPRSLQSNRKTRTISQPRMLAMFLARKYTPAAYKEIGEYFGQRRHSTVISAEKTVETWLNENTQLQLNRGPLSIREAVRHVESHLHVG